VRSKPRRKTTRSRIERPAPINNAPNTEMGILDLSQTVISWLNGMNEMFDPPKDLKEYIDDLKTIVKLKTRQYAKEGMFVAS